MKKFQTYWYQDSNFGVSISRAFLYNCRDADLSIDATGIIRKGEIVDGLTGFCMAESDVFGIKPRRIMRYIATIKVEWQGHILEAMALPNLPPPGSPKPDFRHRHYVVADFSKASSEVLAETKALNLPLVAGVNSGTYGNLELTCFEKQVKFRRATRVS